VAETLGIFQEKLRAQEWRRIDMFQIFSAKFGFKFQKGEDWDLKRHER
jgi:hypothetical protein